MFWLILNHPHGILRIHAFVFLHEPQIETFGGIIIHKCQ